MPTKHEHLERITARIIQELEQGTPPWVKPWTTLGKSEMPTNYRSLKGYRGINVLSLWIAAQEHGYPTAEWLTFKQALELDACVRKGEKATQIVYFEKLRKEKEDGTEIAIPMLRIYHVFNVAQIDGLPGTEPVVRQEWEVLEGAEAFFARIPADVQHGGDSAYYNRQTDRIQLPAREQFEHAAHYYATRAHETTHWTGAPSRLNREFGKRFGDMAYAFEELVAELGAAFTCGHLAIPGELHHASYLEHWIKILKADTSAIFTAAARATDAHDHLLAHQSETLAA